MKFGSGEISQRLIKNSTMNLTINTSLKLYCMVQELKIEKQLYFKT